MFDASSWQNKRRRVEHSRQPNNHLLLSIGEFCSRNRAKVNWPDLDTIRMPISTAPSAGREGSQREVELAKWRWPAAQAPIFKSKKKVMNLYMASGIANLAANRQRRCADQKTRVGDESA